MPAPGTSGKMPQMRKMVMGVFRHTAKKTGNSCQSQRSGKGSDDHRAIALIDQQIAQPPQAAGDARPEILMTGHLKQHREGYGCKKSDNGL